jgi:hypothetical protein
MYDPEIGFLFHWARGKCPCPLYRSIEHGDPLYYSGNSGYGDSRRNKGFVPALIASVASGPLSPSAHADGKGGRKVRKN